MTTRDSRLPSPLSGHAQDNARREGECDVTCEQSAFLFVYGSLRRAKDGCCHPLLRSVSEYVDDASLPGKLYDLGDYPGAVFDDDSPSESVRGEVYRLRQPASTLLALDDYEECLPHHPEPHEYQRILKTVTLGSGNTLNAWVYAYNHSPYGFMIIAGGDYLSLMQQSHD